MKSKIGLIWVFLFLNFSLSAQNPYIKEVENKLKTTNSKEEKYATYEKLIEIYRSEHLYNEAGNFASEMLALAKKEKNQLQIAKAYVFIGSVFNNEENFAVSAKYIDSVNAIATKNDDPLISAYAAYFSAYQEASYYENRKAIPFIHKSLSFLEKSKGDIHLDFKINYLLYGIYTDWNDLPNSEKYALKSIDLALKSGNKNYLSNAYAAMAVVYTYHFDKSKETKDYTKVIDYIDRAIALYNDYPGQVAGFTYTIARNNKANYLLVLQPNITPEIRKEIIFNANESLRVGKNLFRSETTQAGSLGILSELEMRDKNFDKAEEYLLRAETILSTRKPIYYHIMIRVVSTLASLYEQKGDLKKALEYQKKAVQYHNEAFNANEASTVKKLEAQYQTEKKEKEVQLLTERSESQRKQKLLYAGLGIIGLITAFYMFRSYHYRLKYSLQREKQLDSENKEAELQIRFEKEEKARLKAEQELMSLHQQKLQDEVMANQLHIQHKNEVLQQLKEKIEDDKSLNLNQIIREENLLDNDFEKAKFQIQEIHPNFFKTLNEKAKQKLTSLDLKYCAYFYLGMDTKQIANLLNVEPKSVRMTKYRLKQKFGFEGETDLVNYLKEIV